MQDVALARRNDNNIRRLRLFQDCFNVCLLSLLRFSSGFGD